jgi:hypothetical protein
MAHFYGEIQGSRGATTRCGTKNSGMDCHVRGWDIGARLKVTHKDGQDYIEVFVTSGSKAKTPDKLAGTICLDANSQEACLTMTPQFILSKETFEDLENPNTINRVASKRVEDLDDSILYPMGDGFSR